VAVSNVDEVVATIRASADPAEARERLMTRRWPAADIADYIRLIDDPSHTMNEDGTYNLSEVQARAILELRLQRLTAMGVRRSPTSLRNWPRRSATTSTSCARARGSWRSSRRAARGARAFAVPRRTEIVDWEGDMRTRT
jgi:DNA gyrase subunit A